ncbi:MAG: N-acetylneuraminate synthase [Crocinitomicaceae bacterium]|nr:N-acetylneuraminate synthase [Crocinitomicaceae bacterium]|tara:strand:+ start:510 stop:1505 length:996 start_codon:yes stop_codon:yes gene_type:complete
MSKVYIIAEAGVNHNGDINLAKKLIDVAVDAKVDAVKFQAFRTEHLILSNIKKAPYQIKNTGKDQSQSEMLKKLELTKNHYLELKNYCDKKNIDFLITPFDEVSLLELEQLNLKTYKIASTDTTNIPFLRKVASTGKNIILSTGMCYMDEVQKAVESILKINKNLTLMHCTANYPCKDNEVNLNVLNTYKKFNCKLGYSDHTIGFGASLYAIPMGATVIEKHFTIDKNSSGPDHIASLDKDELFSFVQQIRKIETYLGSSKKAPTPSELKTKKSLQKCLVAKQTILKGEPLSENNMVAKRTGGNGISPIKFDEINGIKAIRDFKKNEIIEI